MVMRMQASQHCLVVEGGAQMDWEARLRRLRGEQMLMEKGVGGQPSFGAELYATLFLLGEGKQSRHQSHCRVQSHRQESGR